MNKHYPVQYRCGHCGAAGYPAKLALGSSKYKGSPGTCPSCKWGWLVKMHWNGFRWC